MLLTFSFKDLITASTEFQNEIFLRKIWTNLRKQPFVNRQPLKDDFKSAKNGRNQSNHTVFKRTRIK